MKNENANEWGFEIRDLDSPETQKFLRSILRQDTCVPFLGAGFTRGEKARSANVLGSAEWMDVMRDQIKSSSALEKPSDDELLNFGFQDLSDIYFRENIVPLDAIKKSVDTHFTNVNIVDEAKRKFLSIDWPYIYTLNIDDGIERAINGVRVLPYKPFSRYGGCRYVYKLHGDAEDILAAASHEDLRVIFGKADYIKSLNENQYLISNLINDFSEKNVLFIGCSLNDELDISFALASLSPDEKSAKSARIFVTSNPPTSYSEKKKLKSYGITDVVVGDYSAFYSFAASIAELEDQKPREIESFKYVDSLPFSNERLVSYLLQSNWKHGDNPYSVSIPRTAEKALHEKLKSPLVTIWGRRFSGKTTILHRIVSEARTRRRFFIPSQTSMSDRAFNEIFNVEDALIAIDSGAIHHDQIRTLSRGTDRLADHNTTVLLALSRSDLNALGCGGYAEEAVQVDSKLHYTEVAALNSLLDPLGFHHWRQSDSILDNVFTLGASPIATGILKNQSALDKRIDTICSDGRGSVQDSNPSKLEFSLLYYLAVRQRIYSLTYRALVRNCGLTYMADTHIVDFARKWSPFIELEETDAVSRNAKSSASVLICNSYAWTQLAVRRLSDRRKLAETATLIVDLYISVCATDPEAFRLVFFDNLNSVYSTKRPNEKNWGSGVITSVYEKLASYCAQDPDYWLQRAKGAYYLSNNEKDIRIAIEYCEKGIIEKADKTRVNAKLTKANLLGKLCDITDFRSDEDLSKAIDAYSDAIGKRNENPTYIDELLRKNHQGKGYMNKVCRAAKSRAGLLPKKDDIRFIEEYANQ